MKRKILWGCILGVVLAVCMDYFLFAGDASVLVQQYMMLGAAGYVSSSKEAFANYGYLVSEQQKMLEAEKPDVPAMGQALADAAFFEYQLYQAEKARTGGRGFGQWIYYDWYSSIAKLNAVQEVYSGDRQNYRTSNDAWCARFYSCMAQSVQRSNTGPLLYGENCKQLLGQYCLAGAQVVLLTDSYFVEHMKGREDCWDLLYREMGVSIEESHENIYFSETMSFEPMHGDLVFFHWRSDTVDSGDRWVTHIGIVYDYDAETGAVYVIEGNRNSNGRGAAYSEVSMFEYVDEAQGWSSDKRNFIGYVRPRYGG